MKFKQFWEKCKENWPVKVFCIILSLFIYYLYINITLESKIIVIPLEVSTNGNMLPASYKPSEVKVSLKGDPNEISQITNNDISAILNLDYYSEPGRYDVPIQVELSQFAMSIEPLEVSVIPAVIPLRIAKRVYAQVPVLAEITGEPAEGYQVTNIQVSPKTIQVMGAEPIVKNLSSIMIESVDISDKKETFTQQSKIYKDNKLVKYENISEVDVTVKIEPILESKQITNKSISILGLNSGFEVQLEPANIDFYISGPKLTLNSYGSDDYRVSVDCSNLTEVGEYELPVNVILPSGIVLDSISSKNVKLVITDQPEETDIFNEADFLEDRGN